MLKLGIITYHSAYNYGSALQAYATQQALASLDCSASLINYRMEEQKRFYQPLYRTGFGVKTWMEDLLQIPCHSERQKRAERFESFFENHLLLTEELGKPEEVAVHWQQYDAIISGSDQIWNKHSCELQHNDWRYMDPYLLKGFRGRKISYASSVGSMTNNELQRIIPSLREFDALAFRESVSAEKMAKILEQPVKAVLDPTFLLTKYNWIDCLQLRQAYDERYTLAYFLCGPRQLIKILPVLEKYAKKRGCKVKLVTPFAYFPCPDKRIEYHPEFGPVEFLNALYNADEVITNSYHGTILSVNFGKEFYSVCKAGGSEYRKTDILSCIDLSDRVIYDLADIVNRTFERIDYAKVHEKLDILRKESIGYLRDSLGGA